MSKTEAGRTRPLPIITGAHAPANWLPHPGCGKIGGANRDRTDDLKLAKLALSQLSYGPKPIGGPRRI